MAVKVMVAPAIAKGELAKAAPVKRKKEPGETKPKRRRSSVYDADGNEVFITLMCLKCHKMRPLSQFGLRKMADGAIRNQPWCRSCRSGTGEKPSVRESAETVDSTATEASLGAEGAASAAATAAPEARRPSSSMAAEVAAALAAGLRR
ncbi:hypothetical protein [Anaeromyxobacter oryzae]|uniref:Uncharacterized protein n=1 Tax=Anaeromyxobacter oryzae TaxID=2918170 RepID=A0ABM7WSX1_9BACT|nr:hypothetical protein [Anaeromyxobacter oryzae]BDG02582.1 hypothetical protein AMOR_15780 [Anaeromyxobacter oryzae]